MRPLVVLLAASLLISMPPAQAQKPDIGDQAPEFTLENLDGSGPVSLSDFRGQVVFIFFLGYS
ncbi:MAG: redoxin domain-containing protein [Candidatus Latescibacteria bacterium]|nr:redoxin domain-containing protein [Candidatus Latescibacterota bacterium]